MHEADAGLSRVSARERNEDDPLERKKDQDGAAEKRKGTLNFAGSSKTGGTVEIGGPRAGNAKKRARVVGQEDEGEDKDKGGEYAGTWSSVVDRTKLDEKNKQLAKEKQEKEEQNKVNKAQKDKKDKKKADKKKIGMLSFGDE